MPRARVYPEGLEIRGKRLWRAVMELRKDAMGPGEVVLLEEACRLADRLERLNDQITGAAYGEYEVDGDTVTVVVDRALVEARQQQLALRQVLMSLGLDRPVSQPAAPPAPAQREPAKREGTQTGQAGADKTEPPKTGDPVASILDARARREAGGAGA